MTEIIRKSGDTAGPAKENCDEPVVGTNSSPLAVAARLREAVQQAGGHGAIVAKSGIKSRTLSNLLAGQEAKQRQIVALADATGCSLEWLLTGRGEMRPAPDPGSSLKGATGRGRGLFATVNLVRLGEAMEAAAELFRRRGIVPSSWRLAQVTALVYDEENSPEETVRAHAASNSETGEGVDE